MKCILRRDSDRIHKQDAWKKSAYAFVPHQTNFGELCGFADDVVNAGQGFGMHPHQNMEISTIVIAGAQAHKDNTGSEGIIDEHGVQTMSAGTGIMHSEFNASTTEPFHSFQIWVYPKKVNVIPRHEKFSFQPEDKRNRILLALSPDKRNGTALINQDAFFSVSKLEKGKSVEYIMNLVTNGVYIHCATGSVEVGEEKLKAGDAVGIYETSQVNIKSIEDTELIFVEVPMHRGISLQPN
jgi:redox-sensitive bicupin YhaK (pirin superfamily)